MKLNDAIYNKVCDPLNVIFSLLMHLQAKDRINEKRTFFGRQATQIVTKFFEGERFTSRASIAEYASWAMRTDGPAIWEEPTPIDCPYPANSTLYTVRIITPSTLPSLSIFRNRRTYFNQAL